MSEGVIDEILTPASSLNVTTTLEPESVIEQQQDVRNESLANIEIIVLSVILFLAVAGNALMLLALRRQLKFRPMSRMYFFMFNLSVADLLVAFGNILPQLAWDITYRFIGNDLLCRSVKFSQVFVLYLSTYILTFMALDRYLVVCHHSFSRSHYNLRGLKGPKIFVILAWILSFVFAIPQAFIFSYRRVQGDLNVYDCWAEFIEPWGQQAYVLWFVISAFALPLCIIGVSYGAICCKVISFHVPKAKPKKKDESSSRRKFYSFSSPSVSDGMTDTTSGEISSTNRKGDTGTLIRQISQAKIKSIKLTLVVVICFFVCWAPFCVTQLVLTFGPPITRPVQPVLVIFLLLASLNSCTNPWVYLAFSETLVNQLRMLLGFGLGRGSDDASIGDEQEDPPKERPICKIVIEQAVDHGHGLAIKSFKVSNDDPIVQIQVETKSEVI